MIRVIRNNGENYLTRVTLFRSRRFTLYLHWFHQPDPARDLHNHPWTWCWAVILWGDYLEALEDGLLHWRFKWDPRRWPGHIYHTVHALVRRPVVTLFAHGPQVRTWGFLSEHGHMDWDVYLLQYGFNTEEEIALLKATFHE